MMNQPIVVLSVGENDNKHCYLAMCEARCMHGPSNFSMTIKLIFE